MCSNTDNFFNKFTWDTMQSRYSYQKYDIALYHQILCSNSEYPKFLDKYIALPILQRLKDIGLLCGTDWTPLYHNRFFYSRLDHSIGVALIVWHFTKNKAQTVAALLHDISTPVFSHVSDFRKGDALTQSATEAPNSIMIKNDKNLAELLKLDGLFVEQVQDYHIYPIADNEIPCLSADRLEYMFPSGMALDGSWTMEEIRRCYNDISILKNENGIDELGFNSLKIALEYCRHFCMIGHILQLNENKLALNLLGKIMNLAVEEKILCEDDFMSLSEAQIIQILDKNLQKESELYILYKTFRSMKKIEHTDCELKNHYCVSLKVKQRYINPLVKLEKATMRLSDCSVEAKQIIEDFKNYNDTKFGCVPLFLGK